MQQLNGASVAQRVPAGPGSGGPQGHGTEYSAEKVNNRSSAEARPGSRSLQVKVLEYTNNKRL